MTHWEALAASLERRGIEHKLIVKPYTGGVSRQILVPVPDGHIVIADTWFRNGWTGWQVWRENRQGMEIRDIVRRSKVRREVADAVADAVAR